MAWLYLSKNRPSYHYVSKYHRGTDHLVLHTCSFGWWRFGRWYKFVERSSNNVVMKSITETFLVVILSITVFFLITNLPEECKCWGKLQVCVLTEMWHDRRSVPAPAPARPPGACPRARGREPRTCWPPSFLLPILPEFLTHAHLSLSVRPLSVTSCLLSHPISKGDSCNRRMLRNLLASSLPQTLGFVFAKMVLDFTKPFIFSLT